MNKVDKQCLAALLNNWRSALHAIDVGPCAVDNRRQERADHVRAQIFMFFDEFEVYTDRAATQRICQELTGCCVMVTDPEREPCTAENCSAVRAAEAVTAEGGK